MPDETKLSEFDELVNAIRRRAGRLRSEDVPQEPTAKPTHAAFHCEIDGREAVVIVQFTDLRDR